MISGRLGEVALGLRFADHVLLLSVENRDDLRVGHREDVGAVADVVLLGVVAPVGEPFPVDSQEVDRIPLEVQQASVDRPDAAAMMGVVGAAAFHRRPPVPSERRAYHRDRPVEERDGHRRVEGGRHGTPGFVDHPGEAGNRLLRRRGLQRTDGDGGLHSVRNGCGIVHRDIDEEDPELSRLQAVGGGRVVTHAVHVRGHRVAVVGREGAVRSMRHVDHDPLHEQWNGRGVRDMDLERQMVAVVRRGDG
ncbi:MULTISPECIES: hypothetical protein [unclassified Rhodococcus (in: high G+C Gram-positive bacteria)]|uniref:hypothetical protein n=1 Tax=unclassified Rhodococcus (in: high G+C Gram-positive bacteria) TaxID=192944 RepID=UPI002078EB26|nr:MULTISPECIES: hypothetical protein [unclassified Rhodococcus (in: high G+C Gram-positive bacteria)]